MIKNIFYTQINTAVQRNYFEHKNYFEKKDLSHDKFVKSNDYNPNFKGLSNQFSRKALPLTKIDELRAKYKNSNRFIGSIPNEWENLIKKKFNLQRKEHSQIIKEFYEEFGEIVLYLRKSGHYDRYDQQSATKINNLFHKFGIFSEQDDIKLIKLGKGTYGTSYKVGIEEDPNQYVIKIFHSTRNNSDEHGCLVEANRGLFIRTIANEPNESNGNEANNCQFARFFFSDFDISYIIEQFISYNKKPPKKILDPEIAGIKLTDSSVNGKGANSISGYNFDLGGMRIISPVLSTNSTARIVFEELYNVQPEARSQLWDEIFINKHYGNKKHACVGLAESLKLLRQDDILIRFNILSNINDNIVNEALAYNLHSLPHKDRFDWVSKVIAGANKDVIEALVYSLNHIPGNKTSEAFILFANKADNKNKVNLINQLYSIPKNLRTDCFKAMIEISDNEIKKVLADNLGCLQIEDRTESWKKLAKGANDEINKALAAFLDYLPQYDRFECFKINAESTNSDIIKILENKIKYLTEEERTEASKILNNNALLI